MQDHLEIHVNRETPNVLEVPPIFETTTDFLIIVQNEGQPVHLHINCDDDLLPGLDIETGNHYIPREAEYEIPVSIDSDRRPFRGKCRVSIAYGSETQYIDVRVNEPDRPETVTVDESLAQPPQRTDQPTLAERIVSDTTMLVLLFLAIVTLLAGAIVLGSVTAPIIGLALVIIVLLLAVGVYMLLDTS